MIAKTTGGDLYEITAAEPYVEADLNYNNDNCRATKEQNDKSVRPEIANDTVNLDDYSTIYIGYPIWWGQAPRIMDTFVESHSFDGKKVIPFCTSGSSDIADSDNYLAKLAKSGDWLEGKRFGASASESEIEEWINSNK
jgi:flavodoxin